MTTPAHRRPHRWVPVLALMALAPWAAECSWGGTTVTGFLPVIVVLGPMYGGAAVLIRETARRTGGGWPSIVLLAAAFGVFQAGLVDQSLFNPSYLDDTEFASAGAGARATTVPWPGFSAEQAFDFVGNHVLLSIGAPIAVIEAFVRPSRRHAPWLGRWGLAVVAVVYLLGSLLIFSDDSGRKGFLVSPAQGVVAATVVLALIIAALLPRRAHRAAGTAPRPVWVAAATVAALLAPWTVTGWTAIGVRAVAAVVLGVLVVTWSRRAGWNSRHELAPFAAALVVAAGTAYLVPTYEPATATAALVGDIAISVVTLSLILGAYLRLQAAPDRVRSVPVHM